MDNHHQNWPIVISRPKIKLNWKQHHDWEFLVNNASCDGNSRENWEYVIEIGKVEGYIEW